MNIHLTRHGTGKPLVFFHGWGFDHSIWLSLVPYLADSYQLICLDLPGFGLTPMQTWDVFKKQLLLQLPHQFILAGWSMGGLFATRLAIEAPERVIKLVNITSSPKFIAEASWPGVSEKVFINFYHQLTTNINTTLQDFIKLQTHKKNVQLSLQTPPSDYGLKSGLTLLKEWDLREDLKNLQVSTCFMFGRLDPITPVKTMYMMQDVYPDFKYILFNKAAHMPFISHPDLFIEELSGFIQ